MGYPRPLFRVFSFFEANNFTKKLGAKSSILYLVCWDLNSRPLGQESLPIATKLWLLHLQTFPIPVNHSGHALTDTKSTSFYQDYYTTFVSVSPGSPPHQPNK